jgi:hypothetical protein
VFSGTSQKLFQVVLVVPSLHILPVFIFKTHAFYCHGNFGVVIFQNFQTALTAEYQHGKLYIPMKQNMKLAKKSISYA